MDVRRTMLLAYNRTLFHGRERLLLLLAMLWLAALPVAALGATPGPLDRSHAAERGTAQSLAPGTPAKGERKLTPAAGNQELTHRADGIVAGATLLSTWSAASTSATMVVFVAALFSSIFAWVIASRRRVLKSARLEKSMKLDLERIRIHEAIRAGTPLEELLDGIAASFEDLLPDVRCCSRFRADPEGRAPGKRPCFDQVASPPQFDAVLRDGRGAVVGHFQAVHARGRALSESQIEILNIAADLAARATTQRHIHHGLDFNATHDQLTGLPNRRSADAFLEHSLQQCDAEGLLVGLAYIEIDRFTQVNEEHGYSAGDMYLQQVAGRMRGSVRSTDMVARIGGDEFLLIATGLHCPEEAEGYRRRLLACFERSFELGEVRLSGSASIGVAVSPDHGTRSEDLKRKADLSMYAAKHLLRTGHDLRSAPEQKELFTAEDLERALEKDRFSLFYQPQFSPGGVLCGLEALIRLNDPVLGIISPDAFIGVAERNDVIFPLGAWVLRQALADAVRWKLAEKGVRVMVNISARQVERPDFADQVTQALDKAGLPARCLELEITERMLMRNIAQGAQQLSRLRERGIRIAIDDFGVEHSCLSMLHSLPCDTLKLDRTFIGTIQQDAQAMDIIAAVIQLAQKLGKRITAEGIENEEQIGALSPFHNVDLQGYYFSRPRPAEEIASAIPAWLHQSLAAWPVANMA